METRTLERLITRRDHLAALTSTQNEGRWVDLMRQVDAAIGAIEVGTWGICAVCHDPINAARLAEDPLVTVCLECLSENERRALERDLQSAGKVQRTLLPPSHLVQNGWEVAYHWEPRGIVSGDLVDFIPPSGPGDPLHLVLGDVSGKGVWPRLFCSPTCMLCSGRWCPPENRFRNSSSGPTNFSRRFVGQLRDPGGAPPWR